VTIECPACTARIGVPITAWFEPIDAGRQHLRLEPDWADLWAHTWSHDDDT
jgi:hypothetical protein